MLFEEGQCVLSLMRKEEKLILLGNLTVEQMEKKCGIYLPEDERRTLENLWEDNCERVDGNTKIHIYDIQFFIACGNPEARKTVIDIISSHVDQIWCALQIGGGVE